MNLRTHNVLLMLTTCISGGQRFVWGGGNCPSAPPPPPCTPAYIYQAILCAVDKPGGRAEEYQWRNVRGKAVYVICLQRLTPRGMYVIMMVATATTVDWRVVQCSMYYTSVFSPGPFSRVPPYAFHTSFPLMYHPKCWCGHKLRPNHAHPLCLNLKPGENPAIHMEMYIVLHLYV